MDNNIGPVEERKGINDFNKDISRKIKEESTWSIENKVGWNLPDWYYWGSTILNRLVSLK